MSIWKKLDCVCAGLMLAMVPVVVWLFATAKFEDGMWF